MNKQRYIQDGLIGEQDGKPVLTGRRCKECGKLSFPAYQICPQCGSVDVEIENMNTEAVVLTATTTYAPVPPYKPPFTLAILDVDNEVRLLGRIHTTDGTVPKTGEKVYLRVGKLFEETETDRKTKVTETIDVVGYYFVPEGQEEDK